ncbi:MAG TPA: SCO family protein [Burkholderiaceae bacterium]|nr:SCO family protein [Burkholderiaceae bacterium]
MARNPRFAASRRRLLRGLSAAVAVGTSAVMLPLPSAYAHGSLGPVLPPQPVKDLPIRCSDGRRVALTSLLKGRITAIQFMFTGCSATCPLQGAIFSEAQGLLPARSRESVQLLSLSIDPLADDPKSLSRWLAGFGAGRRWLAGAPEPGAVKTMRSMFLAPGDPVDDHDTQVYLIDSLGQLVYRTGPLPPPRQIATLVARLAG